jgi:hypothetical protein
MLIPCVPSRSCCRLIRSTIRIGSTRRGCYPAAPTSWWFAARQFPQRKYADDDLGNYLARIEQGTDAPLASRMPAAELERMFGMWEQFGILVGARCHSAYEAAFEEYASASRAEKRSVTDEPYFSQKA